MKPAKCVDFIMLRRGKFLVEKRRVDDDTDPGLIEIPGGHIEPGEAFEDALKRECGEELGVVPIEYSFVHKGLYQATSELQELNYCVVTEWSGRIKGSEAESHKWLTLKQIDKLDIQIDRDAMRRVLERVRS